MNFRDFILEIEKQFYTGTSKFTWHGPFVSCSYYLFSRDGISNVNHIGRFENRREDLEIIREKINYIHRNNVNYQFKDSEFGVLKDNINSENNRYKYYDE